VIARQAILVQTVHKQCYLVAKHKVLPQLVVPVLKQGNYRSHLGMHDAGHIATGLAKLYLESINKTTAINQPPNQLTNQINKPTQPIPLTSTSQSSLSNRQVVNRLRHPKFFRCLKKKKPATGPRRPYLLIQFNPNNMCTTSFSNTHLNIILPYTITSLTLSLLCYTSFKIIYSVGNTFMTSVTADVSETDRKRLEVRTQCFPPYHIAS
jgi:hypothetical protein